MRLTASMLISQIGTHDGDSLASMTDQVCLRRCMLNLQKLQLWCMGFASFHSSQMYMLQLPCSWLHLQPVQLPLAQLIVMADCLFPSRITRDLPPLSSSAAKTSACYLGSAFERHVLLALLHPCITLPLDSAVHAPPPDEQSARAHQSSAAWCCSSVFMHTLHCMRLATRSFVLGFTSAGKPGQPDRTEFLKFMHELQVMSQCCSDCAVSHVFISIASIPPPVLVSLVCLRRSCCTQCCCCCVAACSLPTLCPLRSPPTSIHQAATWHQNQGLRCCRQSRFIETCFLCSILHKTQYGAICFPVLPLCQCTQSLSSPGLNALMPPPTRTRHCR